MTFQALSMGLAARHFRAFDKDGITQEIGVVNRLADAYVWRWWSGISCPARPDLQETARVAKGKSSGPRRRLRLQNASAISER